MPPSLPMGAPSGAPGPGGDPNFGAGPHGNNLNMAGPPVHNGNLKVIFNLKMDHRRINDNGNLKARGKY
jgi:hypothetical protein